MDEVYGPPRPKWLRVNEAVHWSEGVGAAIVARAAAGESVNAIGRTPGMPQAQTVRAWARERPAFGAALEAARRAAGNPFGPCVSTYCEETATEIFERLCEGEGLIAICRDPVMPVRSTVGRWLKAEPAFREAVAMAREIGADAMVQQGWDWCAAATPQTAFLLKVKLGHLRWHTGKIAPKTYGNLKPADPKVDRRKVLHVYTKRFVLPAKGPDGRVAPGAEGHWSEEPAKHLYSMVSIASPQDPGMKLPPPAVVREPKSCHPGGDRRARGGAVEAEEEEVEDWE